MSLERILLFDVNRILSFDLNRILTWDIGRALQRPIPPVLLSGLAGWFLAAILLDATDMWPERRAVMVVATAAAFAILPNLVRRLRAQR